MIPVAEKIGGTASVGSPNAAGGSGGCSEPPPSPPAGVLGGRAPYENFLAFREP